MPYTAPRFIVNNDGQLTTFGALGIFNNDNAARNLIRNLSIVNPNQNPFVVIDIPKEVQKAYNNTIDTPLKNFLNKNKINLLIFALGLLVSTIGILETGVL